MIAWPALRKALRDLRLQHRLTAAALAKDAGINRLTVRRVEAIRQSPSYKPELSVIEAWLTATSRQPVWAFLRRFEDPTDTVRAAKLADAKALLQSLIDALE